MALEETAIEKENDLNQWYHNLDGNWLTAIADPYSPESKQLEAMEATWKAEQEYSHDRFLYADRL